MTTYSVETLADLICSNAKSRTWICSTFQVATSKGTFSVGIKAYGKWVQRYEIGPFCDGIPEQKSLKLLRELIIGNLTSCINYL